MEIGGTVEPLLTATSDGQPPYLQRSFTLVQTALQFRIIL